MSTTPFKEVVDRWGGPRPFSKEFGVSYQAVQKWLAKRVPAERVLRVEEVTGVSRHLLRPDLYPDEIKRPSRAIKRKVG